MESNVKQRLMDFIQYKGISNGRFERTCGISNGYLNNLKKNVGVEIMQKIIKAFPELNTEWLLYGKGEMLRQQPQHVAQNNVFGHNNYVGGNVGGNNSQCGSCGAELPIITPEELPTAPIIPTPLTRQPNVDIMERMQQIGNVERATVWTGDVPVDMWHRVRDNSLATDYKVGDMVSLWAYPKGQENIVPGDLYAVDTWSNGLLLRKLFPEEGGYRARAINTAEYPDFFIEKKEVVRIYKVLIMVRVL